jgi:hypothetical protein
MHVGGLRGAGGDKEGVAISRCGFNHFGAQDAIGTGFVFYRDGLAHCLAHGLRQDAAHVVGGAACAKRHDEFDGFVRVALRLGSWAEPAAQSHSGEAYAQRATNADGRLVSVHGLFLVMTIHALWQRIFFCYRVRMSWSLPS